MTMNAYLSAYRSFERIEHQNPPSKFSITAFQSTWSIGVTLRQLVGFTRPSAANHTMSYALVQYCLNRLPMQHLERLGSPFQFLQKHHSAFGFDWVERLKSNSQKLVAILTIMPGEDYIQHYASLVEVAQHDGAIPLNNGPIYCVLYPHLTQSIIMWTGLTELSANVEPGDIVVLGFVAELLSLIWRQDTQYYGLVRLKLHPGLGNLGRRVVTVLAARRPQAICYIAKQGTLLSPDHIHCRIYSPTRYCVFDKGQACWSGDDHPALPINPLSSRVSTFDRGLHVSTPTIVEQDVQLRTQLDAYGAASIDNELAQMARALTDVHEENPSMSRIQLLPIMFITDYLRRPEELGISVPFDLTSRNATVQHNKELFLARAAHLVLEAFDIIRRPKAIIVGTGYGVKTILPALQRRGVEVVGLCGGHNRAKTEAVATKHKIPCVDLSLKEVQACHGANLLFIASLHDKHAALVQEALDLGGFNIICEKPLALDMTTMQHLVNRSLHSSQLCLMNHPLRFYPPFVHLKAASKKPTNILTIDIRYLTKRLAKLALWNSCFSRAAGGGMMLAMATHFLDLIEWLTDSPLTHDSVETITTSNSIAPLPTEDAEITKTPDVESAFKMSGYCRSSTKYSVDCDGAAEIELFSVTIHLENADKLRFIQRKGSPVLLEQRHLGREWLPLKVHLEPRVRDGSPWQASFQCFVEELVEAICMGKRSAFADRATGFDDYCREVGVFGSRVGIV
ncbi:hypothetical protein BDV09DRAFT_189690 [Aspergillus tetrazonus]